MSPGCYRHRSLPQPAFLSRFSRCTSEIRCLHFSSVDRSVCENYQLCSTLDIGQISLQWISELWTQILIFDLAIFKLMNEQQLPAFSFPLFGLSQWQLSFCSIPACSRHRPGKIKSVGDSAFSISICAFLKLLCSICNNSLSNPWSNRCLESSKLPPEMKKEYHTLQWVC